ncbi:MAG TPA: M15 family metallopeptidase [Rectinema sp.]|nr:M15 family metallopeptidase [Rectinema sp.]HQQ31869.1 M15 family metallopeptidase [Rectinema sp.]
MRYLYSTMLDNEQEKDNEGGTQDSKSNLSHLFRIALGFAVVSALILIYLLVPRSGPAPRILAGGLASGPSMIVQELSVLRSAYPNIKIENIFDPIKSDWKIIICKDDKTMELYWAEGRYLPENLLASKDRYRRLIFYIPDKLVDPATLNHDQIEEIRAFGSSESRETAPISATSFFEAIYDTSTRKDVERHITKTMFLGKQVSVHEEIVELLARVEEQILAAAQTDDAVKAFMKSISSIEGYSWRQIRDTNGISFHSMGLAIDILPRSWQNKIIYWNWEKNKGNEDWMLIPLSERWMPPKRVIDIFEKEGFIWGGKWTVWDNMHFEYRPELILGRELVKP